MASYRNRSDRRPPQVMMPLSVGLVALCSFAYATNHTISMTWNMPVLWDGDVSFLKIWDPDRDAFLTVSGIVQTDSTHMTATIVEELVSPVVAYPLTVQTHCTPMTGGYVSGQPTFMLIP